jgi:hypothetical protein
MNNNFHDDRHPAQRISGPNKYLQLAMQTKVPLDIYFTDGEIMKSCFIVEFDALNLLIKGVDLNKCTLGEEAVITRATIKKIVFNGERSKQP